MLRAPGVIGKEVIDDFDVLLVAFQKLVGVVWILGKIELYGSIFRVNLANIEIDSTGYYCSLCSGPGVPCAFIVTAEHYYWMNIHGTLAAY
ncbi:hypothetical protein OAU36_01330 [Gammaproteobacteria bacterium]|jgi:hypothetical protein|nr:hypothetical protein [Gammaproteobacteria bacterium]MDG2338769.1 hypothetical protein [Gammaproteobacteria bacterium]